VTLAKLREMAAMAQFNPREVRPDVLKLIEETGNLPGDTVIVVEDSGVKIQDSV